MNEYDKREYLKSSLESQIERFVVSPDIFSQERLRFVRQIEESLHAFPFYKCLTLKGSLAKGKRLTESEARSTDINMGCFLDFSVIDSHSVDSLGDLCKKHEVDDKLDTSQVSVNDGKYNIFSSYSLSSEELAKIRLARRVIGQVIKENGDMFFKDPFIKPKIWPEIAIISEEGPFSIYSTLTEYESLNEQSSNDQRVNVTRALVLPFGLQIDGVLMPYFKAFFHVLDSLDPKIAEQKWQIVRKAIIANERWGKVNPIIDVQIPRNLAEAKDLYLNKSGPHIK